MSNEVIEALRLTNGRERQLMSRLQPPEDDKVLANSQDFDDLRGELASAAVWLHRVSPGSMLGAEFTKEISDYRSSLEKLQQILPAIHQRLLRKKAFLETERLHLGAAGAWANASRNTF